LKADRLNVCFFAVKKQFLHYKKAKIIIELFVICDTIKSDIIFPRRKLK